jgi:hypothetical protein
MIFGSAQIFRVSALWTVAAPSESLTGPIGCSTSVLMEVETGVARSLVSRALWPVGFEDAAGRWSPPKAQCSPKLT